MAKLDFEVPLHQSHVMGDEEIRAHKKRILRLLKKHNASIVAHYYTDDAIQELAEESGGVVSDSLEMARFGARSDATTLIVAGVKFMGETAKILSPEKRILMPTLEATCSLDLGCPPDSFKRFCESFSDHTVVVYANTSAEIKAMADWVVTSSIGLNVVEFLMGEGKPIIWAPDKFLGSYINKQTGANMRLWNGSCVVHEEFKANGLKAIKSVHPDAAVLVHPESPPGVIELADVVGSTTQIIRAAVDLPNTKFIVATDTGIFHKMRSLAPGKTFIEAPTGGNGATCRSCAHCPWMGMNTLANLENTLLQGLNEISVQEEIRKKAMVPLQRMLDFQA